MKVLHVSFALLLAIASPGSLAQETDGWQILTYPDPAPGVPKTYCYGINSEGDIVGGYDASPTPQHAYLLSEGQYYDLHPEGASSSTAWGINARGDIVGDYWVGGTQEHGFLLRGGILTTIDLEGRAMAHLRDINARGDIAGSYMTTPSSPQQGFVLQRDGTLVEVLPPGATASIAWGINNEGDVSGQYRDAAGVQHGFLRSKRGGYTAIDYQGSTRTIGQKVNARREVVGYYEAGAVWHGFVWRRGTFQQEDYPGAVHTMIHGVNNEGTTCGMMSFTGLPSTSAQLVYGGFARAGETQSDDDIGKD
jgi:uncharacterized membrane protein